MSDNIPGMGKNSPIYAYLNLFGPIFGRGKTYLRDILGYYIQNDCHAGIAEYTHFIARVAAGRNVTPESITTAINQYITGNWDKFADAWKIYTSWTEKTPPPPAAAIRLLCESFVPFSRSYGQAASILQRVIRENDKRANEGKKPLLIDVGQFTEFERDILETNVYVHLDDEEVYTYACYLTYRVERDLYELLKNEDDSLMDLTWSEFLCFLSSSDYMLDTTRKVFTQALAELSGPDSFNFDVKEITMPLKEDDNDKMTLTSIFPKEKMLEIFNVIFLRAEIILYQKLRQQNSLRLSWGEYAITLLEKGEPWTPLIKAFRDALMRIDFKPIWNCVDFEH